MVKTWNSVSHYNHNHSQLKNKQEGSHQTWWLYNHATHPKLQWIRPEPHQWRLRTQWRLVPTVQCVVISQPSWRHRTEPGRSSGNIKRYVMPANSWFSIFLPQTTHLLEQLVSPRHWRIFYLRHEAKGGHVRQVTHQFAMPLCSGPTCYSWKQPYPKHESVLSSMPPIPHRRHTLHYNYIYRRLG